MRALLLTFACAILATGCSRTASTQTSPSQAPSAPSTAAPSLPPATPSPLAPATPSKYPKKIAFWCDNVTVDASPDHDPTPAHALLCAGKFAKARDAYAKLVPYWRDNQTQGSLWLQTARDYFIALLLNGQAADAQKFLSTLSGNDADPGDQVPPDAEGGDAHQSPADKLFIKGDLPGAFDWFVQHADPSDAPGGGTDKPLVDADAALEKGNADAAIAALQRKSGATGQSSSASEQALMLGDLYASRNWWDDAFAQWSIAAANGHNVSDWDFFDPYNLDALEMLYVFRAHLPR